MESKEEIRQVAEIVLTKISGSASDLYFLGAQAERIAIFERLRLLIQEKDLSDDQIAAAVLGWAYERLADED
jgi:hypothetical protein